MVSLGNDVIISHNVRIEQSIIHQSTVIIEHNTVSNYCSNANNKHAFPGLAKRSFFAPTRQLMNITGQLCATFLLLIALPLILITSSLMLLLGRRPFVTLYCGNQKNGKKYSLYIIGKTHIQWLDHFLDTSGVRALPMLWSIITS